MKSLISYLVISAIALMMQLASAAGETFDVNIIAMGKGQIIFDPVNITIAAGDTVVWHWPDELCAHSITSGTNCTSDGLFDSGVHEVVDYAWSYTFNSSGNYPYFSSTECTMGEAGYSVTVKAASSAPPSFANISTRLNVQTGENVMIGGFIVTGTAAKKVLLRGIGPSLAQAGISGVLADPLLELHSGGGALIRSNDNWKDTQAAEIQATNVAPSNFLESAILTTLPASNAAYTAIVKGNNNGTGVGLVEVYDLDTTVDSKLANISTRGFVQTGSNVMIGGFILGNGSGAAKVLARAIGPSLALAGVSGALADPTLELHDANGALVQSNDNWKDTQQAEIQATGIPPTNDLESAIVATLNPGSYTAIVAGKNGATGVALVELYNLQ